MKSVTEYLWFETKKRRQLVNITQHIETLVELFEPRRRTVDVAILGDASS